MDYSDVCEIRDKLSQGYMCFVESMNHQIFLKYSDGIEGISLENGDVCEITDVAIDGNLAGGYVFGMKLPEDRKCRIIFFDDCLYFRIKEFKPPKNPKQLELPFTFG